MFTMGNVWNVAQLDIQAIIQQTTAGNVNQPSAQEVRSFSFYFLVHILNSLRVDPPLPKEEILSSFGRGGGVFT